jgi:soluble lytic murein transglycosylase-like protein
MKKMITVLTVLYSVMYLGSSLPYEQRIEPPAEAFPFIYQKQEESENIPLPPRREIPKAYRALFETTAESAGIPLGVLESIAFVESGFDPLASSPPGAGGRRDLGMFQFNSDYLRWYADAYNGGRDFDPMVPAEAAPVAARHLRFLYDYYGGHWPTVCLAYNAGMAAVDKDEIPDSSFRYLARVYSKIFN